MIAAVRKRVSYSNVIATMALFIALGGVAVAAGLPKNSVGTKQLKRGAVTAAKIRKQAVNSAKLAPKSVISGKLAENSVGPGNIGNGAVTTAKLAANSVIASTIKNSVVTTNKLNNEAVTAPKLGKEAVTTAKLDNESVSSAKLGKGSVTTAKLSNEIGPLTGTLKSGQTLQGMFVINANAQGESRVSDSFNFQFPLAKTPIVNAPAIATPTANCPGLGGGSEPSPTASPGNLCVYITSKFGKVGLVSVQAPSRFGFGLSAILEDDPNNFATGFWAVTAP